MIPLKTRILKKNDTNELIKREKTHRHRKQIYGYPKGKRVEDELGL